MDNDLQKPSLEVKFLDDTVSTEQDRAVVEHHLTSIAQFYQRKFGYQLPHTLQIRFIRNVEQPNDYSQGILYASLAEDVLSFSEHRWHVSRPGFDPTVLAHEFAHFVFWDRVGRQLDDPGRPPGAPVTQPEIEFHAVQEGWCDYMAAAATGDPVIGRHSINPPRNLADWDFDAYRDLSIPQFMGWGAFLWNLKYQAQSDCEVDLTRIIFHSIDHFPRDGDFQAAMDSISHACGVYPQKLNFQALNATTRDLFQTMFA